MLILDRDAALDHVITRSLRATEVVPEVFAVHAGSRAAAIAPPALEAAVFERVPIARDDSGLAEPFAILAPPGYQQPSDSPARSW